MDLTDLPVCHQWPISDADRQALAGLALVVDDELTHARRASALLWSWQQGRCAVCGHQARPIEPGRWDYEGFCLDHDHITALVRGWLCRSCNTSEPHADAEFALYRARPPALMLGVAVRYEHPWRGLVEPQPWLDRRNFDPARSGAHRVADRFARHLTTDDTEGR